MKHWFEIDPVIMLHWYQWASTWNIKHFVCCVLWNDPFKCIRRSIFVHFCADFCVRILTWSQITINTSPKQTAHISNKLQYCQFCHFCLELLLLDWCCAGFRSHWAAAHLSQGNTNAFFPSTMLLGAMLSNVCAKVLLIPLSLTQRHDVSLICVKCGRRKKRIWKKSIWGEGKKSFGEYETEAFN